jgi:drug/metabolite transporter (DMT)-like permease
MSLNIDVLEIAFLNFIFSLIFIFVIIKVKKIKFKFYDHIFLILRGIFGACAFTLTYICINLLGNGRTTIFISTFAIYVLIIEVIFLGEKLKIEHIIKIILCLAGIIIIFYDGSEIDFKLNFLGVLLGLVMALTAIFIKKSKKNNSTEITILPYCMIGCIMLSYKIPNITFIFENVIIICILLVVILNFAAQYLNVSGYKYLSATKISIITYINIPFNIILSYIIFNESMNNKFIIGIILILFSITFNIKLLKSIKNKYITKET